MPVDKVARKRSEALLREMFRRGSVTRMEKYVAVWAMDDMLTDSYEKGFSAWRNVFERVRKVTGVCLVSRKVATTAVEKYVG